MKNRKFRDYILRGCRNLVIARSPQGDAAIQPLTWQQSENKACKSHERKSLLPKLCCGTWSGLPRRPAGSSQRRLVQRRHYMWLMIAVSGLAGASTLVDPTRPPDAFLPETARLKVAGPLQLQATFIYPDHKLAIIGGQLARQGDKVNSYTIINIQRDTVELTGSDEKTVNLQLVPTVKTVSETKKG